jgi:hypothetical protein
MTETRVKSLDFVVSSSVCPHHLGFLGQRPKGLAIPDECLTCEKILDCMSSKPEDIEATPEKKPEISAIERAEELAEEFGEKNKEERPKEDEVEDARADKSTKRTSNSDFAIESPGMLYAHWSNTALISKETLYGWGKVKEVEIETDKGKKMTCKVYPIENLDRRVIQVPDKLQLKLGVKKGWIVKVKPTVKQ